MRLRPLAFLTFQQFPFFSPFRRFIVIPVIYFIIPSPYNHSSIVPPFIHHPGHLFIIPVIYSLIPPLYRHSIHSILILQPFQPFIVALHILVISTISPSFPPSFHHIALSLRRILQFLTIIAQRLFFNSVWLSSPEIPSFRPSAFPFLQSVASSQCSVTPSRYSVIPLSS